MDGTTRRRRVVFGIELSGQAVRIAVNAGLLVVVIALSLLQWVQRAG